MEDIDVKKEIEKMKNMKEDILERPDVVSDHQYPPSTHFLQK